MSSTPIPMHTAVSAALPVVLPTPSALLGTAVPAAARLRAVAAVDAAPPPRGAPV